VTKHQGHPEIPGENEAGDEAGRADVAFRRKSPPDRSFDAVATRWVERAFSMTSNPLRMEFQHTPD
jgi:hypothetical protein